MFVRVFGMNTDLAPSPLWDQAFEEFKEALVTSTSYRLSLDYYSIFHNTAISDWMDPVLKPVALRVFSDEHRDVLMQAVKSGEDRALYSAVSVQLIAVCRSVCSMSPEMPNTLNAALRAAGALVESLVHPDFRHLVLKMIYAST